MCFLLRTEVHNAEGRFIDDDSIVDPRLEVPFCNGSKAVENITEDVVAGRLIWKEVMTVSGMCKVVYGQPRRPKERVFDNRPDKSTEGRKTLVIFPRGGESGTRKFTAFFEVRDVLRGRDRE